MNNTLHSQYLSLIFLLLGFSADAAVQLKHDLQNSRNYLKSDYKVHIELESSVADHCSNFALSDQENRCWYEPCHHEHDQQCDRCQMMKLTFNKIRAAIEDYHQDRITKERVLHRWKQNVEMIEQWKAHLLRTVHQDRCRIDILNALDHETVLVYVDWAMKWLPTKYRESTVCSYF